MPMSSTIAGEHPEGRSKPPQERIGNISLGILAALALHGMLASTAHAATPPFNDRVPRLGLENRTFFPQRLAALPPENPSAPPAVQMDTPPAAPDFDLVLPKLSVLPEPKVKGAFPRGLHPVIKHSMVEASRFLPDGWQLEFMNALRDAPGVWNGPHGKRDHTGGALAVDVWLVNPQGQRLCNFKCAQNFDDYRRFMEMVKHIQDRDFPAYRKQGRWGGYFAGGYANDEMHYDLEPSDWTMAGNWKQGLLPGYAYFGKKGDTLKGMGDMATYRLPDAGYGSIALATAPPVDLMPPLAVPQRTASVAAVVAKPVAPIVKAKASKPQRYAQARYTQPRYRVQRYEDDDERPVRRAYPTRARYTRAAVDD